MSVASPRRARRVAPRRTGADRAASWVEAAAAAERVAEALAAARKAERVAWTAWRAAEKDSQAAAAERTFF